MYGDRLANAVVAGTTVAAVGASVALHYEGLSWLVRRHASGAQARRRCVLLDIFAIVALHVAEIWIFGVAFWLLLMLPGSGALEGAIAHPLLDAVYFSAMTYTTVGYGDVMPTGALRLLAGTESLLGLVLITWSASFTFLEMERHWKR